MGKVITILALLFLCLLSACASSNVQDRTEHGPIFLYPLEPDVFIDGQLAIEIQAEPSSYVYAEYWDGEDGDVNRIWPRRDLSTSQIAGDRTILVDMPRYNVVRTVRICVSNATGGQWIYYSIQRVNGSYQVKVL